MTTDSSTASTNSATIDSSSSSSSVAAHLHLSSCSLLERQPFVFHGSNCPKLELLVTFDRVPISPGLFYQPPPMLLNYDATSVNGSAEFEVNLAIARD